MNITINGERREIPEGLNVAALLDHIGMARDRVAIERNLNILPRAEWQRTSVQANDSFEIVHFVGGGQGALDFEVTYFCRGFQSTD